MTLPLDLPSPGIPAFTQALVLAVASSPTLDFEPPPTLIAVFLLALIVNRGGIILDVDVGTKHAPEAYLNRVQRVAEGISTSVFGLATRCLSISHDTFVAEIAFSADDAGGAVILTGLEDASPSVLFKLREQYARVSKAPRGPPLLVWVRNVERRDDSPAWVLDMFACSSPADPGMSVPRSLARNAIIPPQYIADLRSLLELTHIHPPLETHIANLVAALSLNPSVSAYLSARATATLTDLVRAHRLIAGNFDLPDGWEQHLHAWQRQVSAPDSLPSSDPRSDTLNPATTTNPRSRISYITGVSSRSTSEDSTPGRERDTFYSSRGTEQYISNGGEGYAGGPGGVSSWAHRAGEVPTAVAMLGPHAYGWYCVPANVDGAWALAVRHRVHVRSPGEGCIYALEGSAMERVAGIRERVGKERRGRGNAEVVEGALKDMLETV